MGEPSQIQPESKSLLKESKNKEQLVFKFVMEEDKDSDIKKTDKDTILQK